MNNPDMTTAVQTIQQGEGILGMELGSTRIKAVLIGEHMMPIASGAHSWQSTLADGLWTYSLEEVWQGIQACYAALREDVQERYGVALTKVRALGFSGMMHGYLPFDAAGTLLVPFRTWRNNTTGPAAEALTDLLQYPIPQRWSIAHVYQAILHGEEHVGQLAHVTTLAGYVHQQLTGEHAMGIGEASGMFPIDLQSQSFNADMMARFDALVADKGYPWKLANLLPKVLPAGEPAGTLTPQGAALLDPSGTLEPGIPLCPPEGDAGTGMIATNSIEPRTGNVSAGTSVFAMLVLERELSGVLSGIDLVTTPHGKQVGMAHANNGSADLGAWMHLFAEVVGAAGADVPLSDLYDALMRTALDGDPGAGGLLSFGYISGEHLTQCAQGRPLFVREQDSTFSLANFMRAHLFSSLCALRVGLNVLRKEGAKVDEIRGHGGFFKTPGVGERMMAAATRTPVSTLATAGEGGAWGIALLAKFLVREDRNESLAPFLAKVFQGKMGPTTQPDPVDVEGFDAYFERYQKGLAIERAAVESLG